MYTCAPGTHPLTALDSGASTASASRPRAGLQRVQLQSLQVRLWLQQAPVKSSSALSRLAIHVHGLMGGPLDDGHRQPE